MSSFFKTKKKNVKAINGNEQYVFILRGIDISRLDKDYSTLDEIVQSTSISSIPTVTSLSGVTLSSLSTLTTTESKIRVRGSKSRNLSIRDQDFTVIDKVRSSSFQHEPVVTLVGKEKLSYYLTMRDIVKHERLPIQTKIPCAYCRRIYQNCPIGIPIKYHPSILKTITYYPDGKLAAEYVKILNSRDRKELQAKMTSTTQVETRNSEKDLYKINEVIENEYYDTDLMVCSFNCIYALIAECPSPLYKETPMLIPKLYYDIFGKFPARKILKSPSWKLREEYNGPLSDMEYEKCLQKIDFLEMHQHGNMKDNNETPDSLSEKLAKNMRPIGRMIIVRELD